jgi:hypothetical protein
MTTCFVCEDYAAVCKLCKLPGTRCRHGRKFQPIVCPACTPLTLSACVGSALSLPQFLRQYARQLLHALVDRLIAA